MREKFRLYLPTLSYSHTLLQITQPRILDKEEPKFQFHPISIVGQFCNMSFSAIINEIRFSNYPNSTEPILVKTISILDDTLCIHITACRDHSKDNRP